MTSFKHSYKNISVSICNRQKFLIHCLFPMLNDLMDKKEKGLIKEPEFGCLMQPYIDQLDISSSGTFGGYCRQDVLQLLMFAFGEGSGDVNNANKVLEKSLSAIDYGMRFFNPIETKGYVADELPFVGEVVWLNSYPSLKMTVEKVAGRIISVAWITKDYDCVTSSFDVDCLSWE